MAGLGSLSFSGRCHLGGHIPHRSGIALCTESASPQRYEQLWRNHHGQRAELEHGASQGESPRRRRRPRSRPSAASATRSTSGPPQAGERVGSTAQDTRSVADELRKQGKDQPAKLAEQAAQRAESLGDYLQRSDGDTILRDVEDFGRRQPWAVIAGGLALGFAASRFLKASSSAATSSRARPHVRASPTGAPTTRTGPTRRAGDTTGAAAATDRRPRPDPAPDRRRPATTSTPSREPGDVRPRRHCAANRPAYHERPLTALMSTR